MQLNNTRAVVTGGVSGLGFAVAQHLVAHGGKVALFDINDEKGAAAVATLGTNNAKYFRTDVTDEANVQANIAAAMEFLEGLNAAISCAGILGAGRVLGKEAPMPLKNFASTVMVNLVGSFNVAKAAADMMQHNAAGEDGERGVIVNTASVAAFDGQIGQAAYSASKGGVVGMTLPIARDLSALGIRVNTVAPGLIDTPIYGTGEASEAFKAKLGESVLFPKRLGHAEELAFMVLDLITNPYMNAEVVRVDGGIRMPPK